MLTNIVIKDLAIVSSLDIEFHLGMSALTGETGAGKSILIDALGLILGNRADSGMIRATANRAEITATFDIGQLSQLKAWLHGQSLDADDELIIRRVLHKTGSSKAFINGTPSPLKSLQAIAQALIHIHGQHAHQALLSNDHQRELLDGFANLKTELVELKSHYSACNKATRDLEEFKKAISQRMERQALLRFQRDELDQLNLIEDEIPKLVEQQKKLSHADSLLSGCEQVVGDVYDNEQSVYAVLSKRVRQLEQLSKTDGGLIEYVDLMNQASLLIEEVGRNLKQHTESIELDPEALVEVEYRLTQLHEVARKYKCQPELLFNKLHDINNELQNLDHQDDQLEKLKQQQQQALTHYQSLAQIISQQRQLTAIKLAKIVSDGIRHLNMPDAQFEIEVTPQAQHKAHGLDNINFLVTANKGQPLQALSKVASGGELSRISLVIQVATSEYTGVPSLIFDEVDVGISGAVAQVVGELLRKLGDSKQVLCVTHLPQVASQAHNHYQVKKQTREDETQTYINKLDDGQRMEEIARLLGGKQVTDSNRQNAREMLGGSQSFSHDKP